jgi:hypothetical protein
MALLSHGRGLTQKLGIDGVFLLVEHVCIHFLFGFTAMMFPETNQKGGINIIPSYSQLQVYLAHFFNTNIMFIFFVRLTSPLHLR